MEVKIIRYDDLGQGIATINNKVCFVKKALPDETVEVEIINDKKHYSEAKTKKIISKSKERIEPVCEFADCCYGCNFLHTSLTEEKNFKIGKALNYFSQCDNFYETAKNGFYYRNKVTFHVTNGLLGYYQEASHNLVPINYCYLLNEKINEVLKLFLDKRDTTFNGKVVIRENADSKIMVILEGDYKYLATLKNSDLITNLISNEKVIKGKDYFLENILGFQFKVNYKSFFQVNREGLKQIYIILENFLKNKKMHRALDLYSGTSVLGIFLSKYFQEVVSIEENKNASIDASFNVEINHINNLQVLNGRVEDYIATFKDIDLILVDPARRGLSKKIIKHLNEIKATYLIYISCEMVSLKRDLEFFKENYLLQNLYLVDMFPRTNKVETIAILKLKDNIKR